MSKLGLVLVMMLMAGRINAQNYPAPDIEPLTYFVLIQADDGQPFYVRLDSAVHSSSPGGHLILAPLKDSVYTITVGFPGQTFPEQRYLLTIRKKDWALRLERRDNGWGLLDGQGKALTTAPDPNAAEEPRLAGAKKDDAFSQLMSAIVQDTAVMYNTYAAAPDSILQAATGESPAADTAKAARTDDAGTAAADPPRPMPADTTSPKPTQSAGASSASIPSAPTGVVKLSERKSSQYVSMLYEDRPANKRSDTIDVVIPIDSGLVAPPGYSGKADSPAVASGSSRSGLPFVNSDCHVFATDHDVDRLRVRMLDADKDDDRVQVAYKVFKTKCFSTKQIRALSEVFATDAAKFKFLKTAYPFDADEHFPELGDLLSDPVYTGKFRSLTDHH